MRKLLLLTCLTTLLVPAVLFSGNGFNGQHWGANPEVKKYVQEHIMPVLRQKRLILENELSPAEKAEIAGYRTQLRQLHQQHKEAMQERQEQGGDNAYAPGKHGNWDEAHQQIKEIMQKLEVIAGNHSNTLDDIKKDLEPQRQQWKQDLARLQPEAKNNEAFMYSGFAPHFLAGYHNARARFLLMPVQTATSTSATSPVTPSPANASDEETIDSKFAPEEVVPSSTPAFSVYPNPANNELIAGIEQLSQDNLVTVTDGQGKNVLTLQNVQPSQHIDVSQLPVGTYIIQFKGGNQTFNRKVVIAR